MALTEHLSEWSSCSEVPHAILNVQIVYCPHDSGFVMSCTLGDTTEYPWSHQLWRYGPFDDITDVAADLAKYVSVMGRRRLLSARLAAEPPTLGGD